MSRQACRPLRVVLPLHHWNMLCRLYCRRGPRVGAFGPFWWSLSDWERDPTRNHQRVERQHRPGSGSKSHLLPPSAYCSGGGFHSPRPCLRRSPGHRWATSICPLLSPECIYHAVRIATFFAFIQLTNA